MVASGLAGFFLRDPGSQADVIAAVVAFAPPLAGVIDEIVGGLSEASASLSIIGLVLAAWGTSRLFAALESGVAQMFAGTPRRSLVRRTAWRLGSILVMAGILLAALIGAPALAIVGDVASMTGSLGQVVGTLLVLLPIALSGLSIAAVYRFIPPARPTWRAIVLPAGVVALALVGLTRLFVFLTPRLFGANFVYGTLGAIFVGLAWLNLVFTVILLGAAWVRERSLTEEPVVV